jgi:hypothetical protein
MTNDERDANGKLRWRFAVCCLAVTVLVVVAGGCAMSLPALRGEAQARAAAQPDVSSLPSYDLTGGVWLPNRFVLVNSDFDFSLAMADIDVGPGLAAGQRLERNQDTASKLRSLPPLALQRAWTSALQRASTLSAADREWLGHRNDAVLYGVLFGAPSAQLRVVLELAGERWVWVSAAAPLEGVGSWTAEHGRRVADEFLAALPSLVAMMTLRHQPSGAAPPQVYAIHIEGIAPTEGSGWVLQRTKGRTVIRSASTPATVFSYPAASVVLTEAPVAPPTP